jgi:hypothetical protein
VSKPKTTDQPRVELQASGRFKFEGKPLALHDRFYATRAQADELLAMKLAREAKPEPDRYARRDMRAKD